jgi:hypothetical protein
LCDRICSKAERALTQLAQKVRAPGGVEWEGAAGATAIAQADADVVKVGPFLWGLPDAAAIARRGRDTLGAGQRLALDAVEDAERDGFEVNEDYSVTDTRECTTREQYDQRQAAADAHSTFIRHRRRHAGRERPAHHRPTKGGDLRLGQLDVHGVTGRPRRTISGGGRISTRYPRTYQRHLYRAREGNALGI